MKKIMFIMAALAAMIVSAHTTEQKLFDNTYATVKGGVTALMHPGCNGYENLGHTFEAATGLEIGKWITPHWGFSFDGTNGWTNGSKYGRFQDDYAVNYVTVAGLVKYNLPVNKFNFVAAAGPQWIHGFKKDAADANNLGAKMKLEVNYNVNNRIAVQAAPELNYNFSPNNGNQPYFDARNAWYGLMLGVTYKFGNEFVECPYRYTQADVDALNAEINDLRARQPEVVTRIVEKEVEKFIIKSATEYVVLFNKNSAVLSNEAKSILNCITGDVIVKGGASEDGTVTRNNELSYERAQAVADYLKARNVNVTNVEGMGVTGNRAAIIIVK